MASRRNIALSVITRIVVCSLLLLIALGFYALMVQTKPVPAASSALSAARRVLVMEARPMAVRRTWSGFGTALAMDQAEIPARVTSIVVEIPAEIMPGASVRAGQLLARLDDADFLRQLEVSTQTINDLDSQLEEVAIEREGWRERMDLVAEDVALAQGELARVELAAEGGAVKQREIDRARQALVASMREQVAVRETFDALVPQRAGLTAKRQREAALLELARLSVERCTITSPLAGVLEEVSVEVGENLQSGASVARVVSRRRIEVPLRLSSSARASVAVGDEAVLVAQGGAQTWMGTVDRITPIDDEATRTFAVYVEVEQHDPPLGGLATVPLLTPGRFVEGTVKSRQSEVRSVVPRRALQGGRLTLVSEGRSRSQPVTVDYFLNEEFPAIGLEDQSWAVLKNPLPDGALIIVDASVIVPEGVELEPVVARRGTVEQVDSGSMGAEPEPPAGATP